MTHRILWPAAGKPLMWAEATEGTGWAMGFFGPDVGAGERLGPYSFATWHGKLTEAMHWAYNPLEIPPQGWRRD